MVLCGCGSPSIVHAFWTCNNPERRFYCCGKKGSRCGFITRQDPPMCARVKEIIPGLLRSLNKVEECARAKEYQARRYKRMLVISWVCFIVWVLFVA